MKFPLKFSAVFLRITALTCFFVGTFSLSYGSESESKWVLAVTDSSFKTEVQESKQPVLVDFWATWCGPCRMYGPIVDQLAKDYKGRLKVVRVDVDENPGLSSHFQIQAIPTSILFSKGKVFKTLYGLQTEAHMRALIGQILKKEQEHS
ncbi:MAG TPA: thioredoxin [bacterium]|nr:thioredoxin [bacterium]